MYRLLCQLGFIEGYEVSLVGFPLLILSLFRRGCRRVISKIRACGVGDLCFISLVITITAAALAIALYSFIMFVKNGG